MSNPNPFVPKGSLLDQQMRRRSNLKVGVSCVMVVGVAALVAMLIQGCKRDNAPDSNAPSTDQDTNPPAIQTDTNGTPGMAGDTNGTPVAPVADTNLPPPAPVVANTPAPLPAPVQTPAEVPQAPESSGSEYVVVAGDTLGKIARKNGVSLKALEAANPGVNPRRLKVKQKLVIPGGGSATVGSSASPDASTADSGSETTYTVKSGDTLHRIAKRFGTTVKGIESANGLSTTRIKVGQKLKIPGHAEATASAAPVEQPAPQAPAPVASQPVIPAPAPAPATGAPGAN